MLILTDRELEFLASLNTRWSRLYCNELALLLRENGADRPAGRFRILNGMDAHAGQGTGSRQDRGGLMRVPDSTLDLTIHAE